MTERDMEGFKDILKRYKMIAPKNIEMTTQLGGVYVLDGPQALYVYEVGTSWHV